VSSPNVCASPGPRLAGQAGQIGDEGQGTRLSPRRRPFLDRKAALAWLPRDAEADEHIAEDGPTVFAHACPACAEGIVSKTVDGAYQSGPCRVWIKVAIPRASRYSGAERP
jgi:hypothetical protein